MKLVSVNVGRPAILIRQGRRFSSAIVRRPVPGPIELTADGLDGDRVSDLAVHGGPDKAVCCYPVEHYDSWRRRLRADLPLPAFGENLTTSGLLETAACLGDLYRIGTAVLQISQPRQPCSKLALLHGRAELPKWINQTAYTGFYCRVRTPGRLQAGDESNLLERPHPDLTIESLHRARLDPSTDRALLQRLASHPALSNAWRQHMQQRLDDPTDAPG